MIICKICNRECKNNIGLVSHSVISHKLNSNDYYDKYIKKDNEGICSGCGEETNFINISKGYYKFCSLKCSYNSNEIKEKKKNTNLEKYGVKNPSQNKEIKEKKKQTCLKNYKTEYPLQNKSIIEKIKKTNLKKYGVENVFQNNEIKEKIKKINIEKYKGYPSQNKVIREKQKNTLLKKYNNDNPMKIEEIKYKSRKKRIYNMLTKINKLFSNLNIELLSEYKDNRTILKLKCLKCNNIFKTSYFNIQQGYTCPICFPRNKSKGEKQLLKFIKSIESSEIIENSRDIIPPYELDIYIPEKNIAIEFDGLYWHSEEKGKDKYYHLNKTKLCESKNIRLIHIFEDEWILNNIEIKNLLKKIIIKNYDLIENNKIKLILNRRYSENLSYYINKGYSVSIKKPKLHIIRNFKIWDCGYLCIKIK